MSKSLEGINIVRITNGYMVTMPQKKDANSIVPGVALNMEAMQEFMLKATGQTDEVMEKIKNENSETLPPPPPDELFINEDVYFFSTPQEVITFLTAQLIVK